jgi:hypothetical protein
MTKARVPSAVAAGVLAVLTLAVFYVLQDYGPASAIRRFDAALLSNDAAGVQQVIDSPIGDPDLALIVDRLRPYLTQSSSPEVARIDRQQGRVRIAVVYPLQNKDRFAMIWVVDKKGPLWKINTKLTAAVIRDGMLE